MMRGEQRKKLRLAMCDHVNVGALSQALLGMPLAGLLMTCTSSVACEQYWHGFMNLSVWASVIGKTAVELAAQSHSCCRCAFIC